MYIDKNKLLNSIFFPRKSSFPKDENDHMVKVDSNNYVGIRTFINSNKSPNILFFHGNGEIAREYDDIASYYNEYGINLIVSDYRGYGLSSGSPSKDNIHLDSIKVYDYFERYLSENNLSGNKIIMGRSLGSASAAHIISQRFSGIDGCIIESGFATEIPLLKLMNIDPDSIGFRLKDGFDNLSKFKDYTKPLFIIHADLDDIIPFSQADMIMIESKSSKKDIFKVNGAGHNNILSIAREHYFSNIRDFIEKIWT